MYPSYVYAQPKAGDPWLLVLEIVFWLGLLAFGITKLVLSIRRRRDEREVEQLMKRGDPGTEGPRNPWEDP